MVIIYCLAVILECLLQEFLTSVTTGLRGQAGTSFERQKRPMRSDYRCGSRFEHLFERHKQKLFQLNYLFFRLFILYSDNSHRFLTIT